MKKYLPSFPSSSWRYWPSKPAASYFPINKDLTCVAYDLFHDELVISYEVGSTLNNNPHLEVAKHESKTFWGLRMNGNV